MERSPWKNVPVARGTRVVARRLFDYVTACTECKSGLIAAVLSMVVMVWAVLILIVCRGTNLSRAEKQVL